MSSTPSPLDEVSRVKYPVDDPRLKPSSASLQTQATFLRRLGRIRASQPATRPGRLARGSLIVQVVTIPFVFVYSMFFVNWGPDETVFSGPQRWLKRQQKEFWSLPSDGLTTTHNLSESYSTKS